VASAEDRAALQAPPTAEEIEGPSPTLQRLDGQIAQNWITDSSTAEALKHENYLYLARAVVYAGSKQPLHLLAERIEKGEGQED
jgi:hypothetical protein